MEDYSEDKIESRGINPSWVVFMIGMIPFALLYYPIKGFFENKWIFVLVAITYLLVLRFVSETVSNKFFSTEDSLKITSDIVNRN